MGAYSGISKKTLVLLAENKLHDNKNFYEAHKETLKQGITIPLRQVVLDLSENLLALDNEMYVEPVYSVSRIRRDTRYTKDKTLYRDHLWVMLRRNKKLYRNCPGMWFEVCPDGYNYGIGFFTDKPRDMEVYRQTVLKHPDQFRAALSSLQKFGLKFESTAYKKEKITDAPADLLPYLNVKDFCFIRYNRNLSKIEDEKMIKELKKMIKAVTPLYYFLMDVHNEIGKKETEPC